MDSSNGDPAGQRRGGASKPTVVVVDDHTLFRHGLRALLESDGRVALIGEAESGERALEVVEQTRPDVVVMDLNLGLGMDGVEATRRLRAAHPRSAVVVVSGSRDENQVVSAMRAGACGYLVKTANLDQVVQAILLAATGGSVIDPSMTLAILEEFRRLQGMGDARPAQVPLSAREVQLLQLLGDGMSNRQISEELRLAESTVKNNLSSLFQKIGVRDRTQAVLYAIDRDIVLRGGRTG
jgi:two-component system, NarL family, response regulator DegU